MHVKYFKQCLAYSIHSIMLPVIVLLQTFLVVFFIFYFIFCLFRAALKAYGSSRARGQIRAVAASLPTAVALAIQDPSWVCDLHHSSRQCQILNPLSDARDWTCNLMVPRRSHFCWATMGTPTYTQIFFSSKFYVTTRSTVFVCKGPSATEAWLQLTCGLTPSLNKGQLCLSSGAGLVLRA